ncbi:hypothetical protein BQ8420_30270 [Nocardiopsis sp. JB363]|nr:hypothetical protein BQ8420_30270 [Nocardiopsis sp. JB363]
MSSGQRHSRHRWRVKFPPGEASRNFFGKYAVSSASSALSKATRRPCPGGLCHTSCDNSRAFTRPEMPPSIQGRDPRTHAPPPGRNGKNPGGVRVDPAGGI